MFTLDFLSHEAAVQVAQLISLERIEDAIKVAYIEGKKSGIKACSSLMNNLTDNDDFMTQPTYLCPLDTDICILQLSNRIYSSLNRQRVKTIGDLLTHSRREILSTFRGIGKESLENIEKKLSQFGYKLKDH